MKCNFKKPNGETCKNLSLKEDRFCYWHSKKIPDAEKQRSKGGKNKIIKTDGLFPEISLNTIGNIIELNSLMINKILKNEADVRLCTGIGYLLNLQVKCIELNTLEKRIDEVEKVIVHIKLPEGFKKDI